MSESGRYEEAERRFFAAHADDPREVERGGRVLPWSVLYHERMAAWLTEICPEAGEALRLAVGCQHLRRWRISRDRYPEGKLGYKAWRRELAHFHGDEAATILREVGYGEETVGRVRELLLKSELKRDPEVQALEDAACLVFLENELEAFSARHAEEKVVVILRKTWQKMSARGREEALELVATLPEKQRQLIERAL